MSDNHPETSSPRTPETPAPLVPKLQREAVVMVNERGRLGLLVALCSLAGVAVGFALSSMAMGMHSHYCSARMSAQPAVSSALVATETPTWLGVRITSSPNGGAHVQFVEPGSPAERAGIQRGDVVTGFAANGCPRQVMPVRTAAELVRLVRSSEVGDKAVVELERDGTSRMVRTRLRDMPLGVFYEERGRR